MQNPAEGTSDVAIKHSPVFLLLSRLHGLGLWGWHGLHRGAPTLLAGAEGEAVHTNGSVTSLPSTEFSVKSEEGSDSNLHSLSCRYSFGAFFWRPNRHKSPVQQ